ncbi:ATP-dependent DNA helicase [Bacillus sp. FJAT-18017]|uniref:RecQ family ATP-dependent DNA helicase n=1 Tax=Bacillus sp. FJAT-18017 TaxID=1705566 RepID=UPI0006AF0BDC|nr:ATP-dependent DNA helicase RecQ [Bacillus sp. FJAT-18017]ALC90084.1 ATP-dependent DNA helicase [Bacillus sp. FJAT-18017]
MLKQQLYKYFGYSSFRPGQEEVVSSILAGKDTLAMLPTGTGKSLCFQLPGYIMDGSVVIISPLLSLMQDQVEQMRKRGEKRVIAINSFLSPIEKKEALAKLPYYKFIFLSPEMLTLPFIIDRLREVTISLLAIDEAHCISQWGYDFRPDYLKLGDFRQRLGNPLTLALTATATIDIREDIVNRLEMNNPVRIVSSVDRPNISFQIEKLGDYREKERRILELVGTLKRPGIIYFSSKRAAEQTAAMLRSKGFSGTMPYHGGMDQEQRILIQQQFLNSQLDIICATSAFGMGVDKEDIRFVIHYHMPMQIESYLQEIGRAGRDGEPSLAILLYAEGDDFLQYNLAEGELPSGEQLDAFFSYLKMGELKKDQNAFFEHAREAGGLTDTQWRWLKDALASFGDENLQTVLEELKSYVANRNRIKVNYIHKMKGIIDHDGCIRNYFLDYFQEPSLEAGRYNCCDKCGLQLTDFMGEIIEEKKAEKNMDWKKHLSFLLLGEVNEK